MKASVIVLSWNGIEHLDACLSAVLAQDYPDFELIVVDNGSTDGSAHFVAQQFPQVRLIRNDRNLGYAAGNNVGLRAASGALLVLLNQDTEVHPGWLAALASMVGTDSNIGIVGAKALFPSGRIQHAGGQVGERGQASHLGYQQDDTGQFDQTRDVDYVTGASLAISRHALESVGELDEGFTPAYYEDVDWCYRVRAAGFRIVYTPHAVLTHKEASQAVAPDHEAMLLHQRNRLRFVLKHWPIAQLAEVFLPAERAWLEGLEEGGERLVAAMHHVYLSHLLDLAALMEWRRAFLGVPVEEAHPLASTLLSLRRVVPLRPARILPTSQRVASALGGPADRAGQSKVPPADIDGIQRLRERSSIQQVSPQSEVPVLGPLLSALRRLWNRAFTEWYIVPMIQQQNEFNALLVEHLAKQSYDHRRLAEVLATYVGESGGEIAMLAQEILKLRLLLETESDEGGQD